MRFRDSLQCALCEHEHIAAIVMFALLAAPNCVLLVCVCVYVVSHFTINTFETISGNIKEKCLAIAFDI